MKYIIILLTFVANNILASNLDSVNYYLNTYNYQKVINIINNKTAKNINDYKLLGLSYYKLGETNNSKKNYLSAYKIDSLDKNVLFNLGKINFEQENYSTSEIFFDKLYLTDTTNTFYIKQLINIDVKTNKLFDAKKQLLKLLKINNKDTKSIITLSKIYLSEQNYIAADSLLKIDINNNFNNKKYLYQKIKTSYLLDNYNECVDLSKIYLKNFTANKNIYKILGLSYYNTNNYDSCIKYISEINDFENSEILSYYVGLSYFKKQDYKNSALYFDKTVKNSISTNIDKYYLYLAFSNDKNNDYKLAIKNFNNAYNISKQGIILYYLASEYDKFYKDKKIAARYYQKYISLNDTNNVEYFNYSKYRLRSIKEKLHFLNDTL